MASVKKQVKKFIKANEPDYKGMTRQEKKAAKEAFEAEVEVFTKDAKKKRRKKKLIRLALLNNAIGSAAIWRMFHSRKSKKYKRRELGRR